MRMTSIWVLIATLLPWFPSHAQTNEQYASVRVVVRYPSGINASGSGVVIGDDGNHVLTCKHVVQDPGYLSISIHTSYGTSVSATLDAVASEDDLAMLSIDQSLPHAHVHKDALSMRKAGIPYRVIGYPGGRSTASQLEGTTEPAVSYQDKNLWVGTAGNTSGGSGGGAFTEYNGRTVLIGIQWGRVRSGYFTGEQALHRFITKMNVPLTQCWGGT